MRLTLETKAVGLAFALDDLRRAIDSSVLSMSDYIHDEYSREAREDGSGFYKEILARIMSDSDNYFYIGPEFYSKYSNVKVDEFLKAAYINGNQLVSATDVPACKLAGDTCGVEVFEAATYKALRKSCKSAGVLDIFDLSIKTKVKPELITRFCKGEVRVVVYDRYFNSAALDFVYNVAKNMSSSGELVIISDFSSGVTEAQARAKVKSLVAFVKTYLPNFDEPSDKHDRHVHLGDRLHMTFSSGTDCFGSSPHHRNSECQITIYHVAEHSELKKYPVKIAKTGVCSTVSTKSKKIMSS